MYDYIQYYNLYHSLKTTRGAIFIIWPYGAIGRTEKRCRLFFEAVNASRGVAGHSEYTRASSCVTLSITSPEVLHLHVLSQQTQNICITFIQCWTNVEDVGPTLYKCYTNVLYLLGYIFTFYMGGDYSITSKHDTLTLFWYNVGPPSTTSAQQYTRIGSTSRVCWEIWISIAHYASLSRRAWCVI